jgi:hypothetical protein
MGEITDLSKGKIKIPGGAIKELGGIPGATSKLNQAKGLVDSINSTINSVQKLLGPVIERAQGQQQVNRIPSPTQQEKAMSPGNDVIRMPEKKQDPGPSDQDLIKQFSTPEGLKKLDGILEQVQNNLGDCKISELRGELESFKQLATGGKKE